MEVFDAAGNPLTRWSDYEWYELIATPAADGGEIGAAETAYAAASGIEVIPEPGSAGLLAAAAFPLLMRRRR
jgi:hypothetical protein